MTCAEKRVVDDVCETAVNGAPLVAQVAVEDGRQERVREADHPALALNYLRGEGRLQRVCLSRSSARG
jgi:hypothetical protein